MTEKDINEPLQFGTQAPGEPYLDRPGVYGIAIDWHGRVLVARVRQHLVLPGGGIDAGEDMEAALRREYREETGFKIQLLGPIGRANQFVRSYRDGTGYNKLCQFYRVELVGKQGPIAEPDHHPEWISLSQAAENLMEEAHRWAIRKIQDS
ncbi:MAG: NUDIX domain-containing protein [Pseudomonadota bacterium]